MSQQRPSTARSRLVASLTGDILGRNEPLAFPILSEHQLCRKFKVSRVTVRLALSDLENRGLIYRKHGKGTFAHGTTTRVHRYLGILMRSGHAAEYRPIAEMVRGALSVMAGLRSGILLISTPPAEWQPDKASSLGGVIVVPEEVSEADLQILRDRGLPYLIFGESVLDGPFILLGQRAAAREMTERLLGLGHRSFALLSGFNASLDVPKRRGVHDAFRAAGIDPATVPEFSAQGQEGEIFQAALKIIRMRPRPTAVVCFDDSLGSILSFQARRQEGLNVPGDMSIVSFHDWPYLNYIEPALTTARFEFFTAGQRAAQVLSQAALLGQPVVGFELEGVCRAGQTVGPVPGGPASKDKR